MNKLILFNKSALSLACSSTSRRVLIDASKQRSLSSYLLINGKRSSAPNVLWTRSAAAASNAASSQKTADVAKATGDELDKPQWERTSRFVSHLFLYFWLMLFFILIKKKIFFFSFS